MEAITEEFLDLFERKSHAMIVTMNSDGIPHRIAVWVDYDGEPGE